MEITLITEKNMHLIPTHMSVDYTGEVALTFNGQIWSDHILQYPKTYKKMFPTSKPKVISELQGNRLGYICLENEQYVGHAVVERKFNNTLYIEDFDIAEDFRKKHYARKLMDKIIEDHRQLVSGISLEVQHTNVIAFIFYKNYGFQVGGFDHLIYSTTPQKGEYAIHMYLYF